MQCSVLIALTPTQMTASIKESGDEQMTEAVHVAAAIRGGATFGTRRPDENIVKKLEL